MKSNNIQAWLRSFLTELRKRYTTLSDNEKTKINMFNNFTSPCQMLFLDFRDPNLQYLIVTHYGMRSDGEIEAHEFIRTHEALDLLETILMNPKWDIKLSEEERKFFMDKTRFPEVLEEYFLNITDDLKNAIFARPLETTIEAKGWLTTNSSFWKIKGNIGDLDFTKEAEKIVMETRKVIEAEKAGTKSTSAAPLKSVTKGYGTYFYPPIWIGKLPVKTFREEV